MKSRLILLLAGAMLCAGITSQAGINTTYIRTEGDSATNKPAPSFQLKDMHGNTVSLSDYKGKIVVIDFWATWCVPCLQSFPAFQLTVDKYKNDPNVVFLFIDTREKSENAEARITKLLEEKKYTFKVILDEKGEDGAQNVTYKKYGLIGVPTKYVIDGEGIIRFESIGYDPRLTDQQAADNLAGMIEKARQASGK
ncbi:MAG TPA: redoxin domain-containing protein [Ohtaekwangia sp.]|uniref:TlpA family protein disulfide reductase n=1 Tax=Ohtaekwangia sp. TaxID=2066019 RepID=UPI002F9461D3